MWLFFLSHIVIFSYFLRSPNLPSSFHPVWLSAFLFVLCTCWRLDSFPSFSHMVLSCLLPTSQQVLSLLQPSQHTLFQFLWLWFSTPPPSLGPFSSFPVSPPLPCRHLNFRPPERVRRWRQGATAFAQECPGFQDLPICSSIIYIIIEFYYYWCQYECTYQTLSLSQALFWGIYMQ